jgi:putative endonuclease
MYYVYILKSPATRRYYVGSTEDLNRRLREHNGELPNLGRSTLAGRPWTLAFSAGYDSRSRAVAAERFIKSMKSRKWIGKLIEGTYRLPG